MLFWQDEFDDFDREQRFFGTSFAWEGGVDTDGRITRSVRMVDSAWAYYELVYETCDVETRVHSTCTLCVRVK